MPTGGWDFVAAFIDTAQEVYALRAMVRALVYNTAPNLSPYQSNDRKDSMNIIEVKGAGFPLGRRGENLVTQIRFPVAGWAEKYGDGTFGLLAQRQSDANPYPVAITTDSEYVYWNVSSADTGVAGIGKVELRYTVGEALAKSMVYITRTAPALEDAGEAPEPYESWVNEVMDAAENVEEIEAHVEEIVANLYVEDPQNDGNLIVHGFELR